jgi:enoyl-CoA hydratase/carnithine racemase
MTQVYRTLRVAPSDEGVLGVVIDAPPMNLIGPELVRDLVGLIGALESGQGSRVVVLESADPEYFVPHVDLTKVAEYTAEAAKAGGPDDASLGMLWHKLSELPVVSIAKIRGRARGAGSELALACDAVCEATGGSSVADFAAMFLGALRGNEEEVAPLIEATLAAAEAAGQGGAVTGAHWAAAVLHNGLGRYADAMAAAQEATRDVIVYVSILVVPELVEAAARAGNSDVAAGALQHGSAPVS